jgi:large subunit ribosomal protein L29
MAKSIKTLTTLNDAELVAKLAETKQELFNLRFQRAQGQLENPARLGLLKKDVARINMLLRNREIAAAEALAGKK